MISIRRIAPGEGELFRKIRLAALLESPSAFGSTYASALERSDASWREQADRTAQGLDRATFLALADDEPVGVAALYRDEERLEVGEILQVWVAPAHRGTRAASDLLDAIFEWAKGNDFRTVLATITKGNERALRFYEKYGFKRSEEASRCEPEDFVLAKLVDAE